MTEFEQYIKSYFSVSPEDIAKITAFFRLTTLKKGQYFLKPGIICDKLSFHKSGIIRVYSHIAEREITHWISTKGYFITDLAGILFNQPAKIAIQALTDCELYTIGRHDYQNLGRVIPRWHELEKLFIARCFILLEERTITHISMTAEERFKLLFSQQPELFNQVPLQYLASMLGMTPETLSRLRRKMLSDKAD